MLTLEKTSNELVLGEDDRDALLCIDAYLAHSQIRARKGFFAGEVLNEEDTTKVLQGIAKISLEHSGFEYRGLSQPMANDIIDELSGSVEDFFYPILRENS